MVEKGKKEKHEEQVQFAPCKQFCDDTTVEKHIEEIVEEVVEVPRVHIEEEIIVREIRHQVMVPNQVDMLRFQERVVHQQVEHIQEYMVEGLHIRVEEEIVKREMRQQVMVPKIVEEFVEEVVEVPHIHNEDDIIEREVRHQVMFPKRVEVLQFHGRIVHQQAGHTQEHVVEVLLCSFSLTVAMC